MATLDSPKLMLVEDDPDTAALICETLTDHFGPECTCLCTTVSQAIAHGPTEIDLVLTDMNLPDGSGLDVLTKFLELRPDLPIILVTGEGVLENALAAIRQGAYDYIVKAGDYLFAIPVVVEKNLAIWRTKQENTRLQEQVTHTLEEVRIKNKQLEEVVHKLETVAATDPLTGLANRRAFNQAMHRCFAEANRYQNDLACILIDLDGFKRLNDTLGHPAGDELLQRTARVLEANCRCSDIAGRLGGDEFILLLPQTDMVTTGSVARRIYEAFMISAKKLLGQTKLDGRIGISMGMASLGQSAPANPEDLISCADHAMYLAKDSNKTSIVAHQPGCTKSRSHISAR